MENIAIDYSLLVNALLAGLTILAGVLSVVAVLAYRAYEPLLKAKIGEQRWDMIKKQITGLIKAAEEQAGLETGMDKEDFVVAQITHYIETEFDLEVNEEFLRSVIKGVFRQLVNWDDLYPSGNGNLIASE